MINEMNNRIIFYSTVSFDFGPLQLPDFEAHRREQFLTLSKYVAYFYDWVHFLLAPFIYQSLRG